MSETSVRSSLIPSAVAAMRIQSDKGMDATDDISSQTARPIIRRGEAKRNEILLAAAQLFAEKGYSECNLRELSERVGIKTASLYYHFRSKEEILDQLLSASTALVSEEVNKALTALGPDTPIIVKLDAAIRAHVTPFLSGDDKTTAIMRIWQHLPPALKKRNRVERREYAATWYSLVEEGIREGLIRDDIHIRVMVPLLIGSMSRALEWYNPKYMTIDEVCNAIQKVFLNGGIVQGWNSR